MAFSITDIIIVLLILISTIIGFVRGIASKLLGIINLFLALTIAYYVAGPISGLLVDTSFYELIENAVGNELAGTIFLIVIGIIVFIIVFIILKLIRGAINRAINSGRLIGAINRLLGGVIGFIIGLLLATVYLLIFYGIAKVDPNIGAFYVSDLAINTDKFTLSKFLLEHIMKLFGNI